MDKEIVRIVAENNKLYPPLFSPLQRIDERRNAYVTRHRTTNSWIMTVICLSCGRHPKERDGMEVVKMGI